MVICVLGWLIAIIRPGRPAPLPMSSTFCEGFMCSSIVSQSRTSKENISSSEKRPTMLCALLNFKISFIRIFIESLVLFSLLIGLGLFKLLVFFDGYCN